MGDHRVGVGLQFATVPASSGTRSGYGWEIGPRCRGSEIARQCGAVVGQERSSGKPGGLFLWCRWHTSALPLDRPTEALIDPSVRAGSIEKLVRWQASSSKRSGEAFPCLYRFPAHARAVRLQMPSRPLESGDRGANRASPIRSSHRLQSVRSRPAPCSRRSRVDVVLRRVVVALIGCLKPFVARAHHDRRNLQYGPSVRSRRRRQRAVATECPHRDGR